jgi:hypothetical protein
MRVDEADRPARVCCRAGWTQYLTSLVDYVDRDGGNAFGSASDERAAAWREHQADAAS